MNKLIKGVIFGGKARVTAISITNIVNEEIKIHNLSPLATAAIGRALCFGAYLSANLKFSGANFSLTINGGGPLGSVVVAGEGGNRIRGFVSNPCADAAPINGCLPVSAGVGTKGALSVVKDLGLKQPYVGRCELINGELVEDFSYYLAKSEGINSAISLGVSLDKNGCRGAGGIIVEALPGLTEDMLFMIDDIMTNFSNIGELLVDKDPQEILDFYFGHLDAEFFPQEEVSLYCNCSQEKLERLVVSFGKEECEEILQEIGKIELVCHFCEEKRSVNREEVEKIWQKYCQ